MTTPQTPAGWYPDPDGSGGQRYWDGLAWTEHRTPAPQPPPPPPPDPKPAPAPAPAGSGQLLVRYLGVCTALLAVLVAVVVYAVVTSGSGDVTISASDAPTESGDPTDGALAFSVYGVEIGPTVTSADAPVEKTAVGEFVVVRLSVTNIGDAPVTFLGTLQKLDAAGTVFSIDDEATFYAGGGLAELNPGDQVDVGIAFDVPPGTVPEAIELHADPLSPGVVIPLT